MSRTFPCLMDENTNYTKVIVHAFTWYKTSGPSQGLMGFSEQKNPNFNVLYFHQHFGKYAAQTNL